MTPIILFLLLSVVTLNAAPALYASDIQTIKDYVIDEILTPVYDTECGNQKNCLAKLVRLSFHDCVSKCDGCLNIGNSENNGLSGIIGLLEIVYAEHDLESVISRADFWALAGQTAVEEGARNQGPTGREIPTFSTFQWGRQDCDTAPYTQVIYEFPSALGNLDDVTTYFNTTMGLNPQQVVALLGAHSLGDASPANSGFAGPWAPPSTTFDNEFYTKLQETGWEHVDTPGPGELYQFELSDGGPATIMLNADMALYRNFTVNNTDTGFIDCESPCGDNLPYSHTHTYVDEYAADKALFMIDFVEAWELMTSYVDFPLYDACTSSTDEGCAISESTHIAESSDETELSSTVVDDSSDSSDDVSNDSSDIISNDSNDVISSDDDTDNEESESLSEMIVVPIITLILSI